MDNFNPVSTSGIGFQFEHYVQASYVSSLLLATPVPFSDALIIEELFFQAKHVAETDDLIVKMRSGTISYTHYIQAKTGFEINKNETFDKVIKAAFEDFSKMEFNQAHDRIIIYTNVLSKADVDNALTVLEWARFSSSATDFHTKLNLNKSKKGKYIYFKNSLEQASGKVLSNDEIWKFLKCFHVKTADYLSTSSRDEDIIKWFIKPYLFPGVHPTDALKGILDYVTTCNQHGATVNVINLPESIKTLFEANRTDKISTEVNSLLKKSLSLIEALENDIDGFHLDRGQYNDLLNDAVARSGFVLLTGEGGVGKSAIVKTFLNLTYGTGLGFISLKADLLDRSTLAQTFSDIGVQLDFDTILAQWMHMPKLIIYVDGFEKLYESERGEAFLELLKKIKGLPQVTLIATCRSYAYETLRKKFRIASADILNIMVYPLTDVELQEVVKHRPQVQRLVNNPRLSKIIALPFYLDHAIRLAESLDDAESITETEFKNAIWENGVEMVGFGKIGFSKRRGVVFSKIAYDRAIKKITYISCEEGDIEIAELLYAEGLLIKHPNQESYAPKHDILEDIVVGKILDKQFAEKTNANTFIDSIDSSPIIRRGLRTWIQDIILSQPQEAKLFLTEILTNYKGGVSITDELIVGILGSDNCFELLEANKELLLADEIRLYYKFLHLAKTAYILPYSGNPKKAIRTFGPGWDALVGFLINNYQAAPELFQTLANDLFNHWILQYEVTDNLPTVAEKIAMFCLQHIEAKVTSHFNITQLIEVLFYTLPANLDQTCALLTSCLESVKSTQPADGYSVSFYRALNKMLLNEPYKCEKVYKFFPQLIIELAKMEWFTDKLPSWDSTSYQELSFGLVSYPYKYFSPSALQTPLIYLLKYHFPTALDFILMLTNRGLVTYARSSYGDDLIELMIVLNDGTEVKQLGNQSLYTAYRGAGAIPDLIQSVLMALEVALLEKAAQGENLNELFKYIIRNSNSVLITGVLVSVAVAHPSAFGKEIYAIFKTPAFFAWEVSRLAQEFSHFGTATIGNDSYYTNERRQSNHLPHRRDNLEMLVRKFQLYYGMEVDNIIDDHLKARDPEEHSWQMSLLRMDLRNTEPEFITQEDEQMIAFVPKPLPEEVQKRIAESNAAQKNDTHAISIFIYAEQLYSGESKDAPDLAVWREYYSKLQETDLSDTKIIRDPHLMLAAAGLKYFSAELNQAELIFCVNALVVAYPDKLAALEKNGGWNVDLTSEKSTFHILPKLLDPELAELINHQSIKAFILKALYLANHELRLVLIDGIKIWLWNTDSDFALECFQMLLKLAHSDGNVSGYGIKKTAQQIQEELDAIVCRSVITPEEIDLSVADNRGVLEALSMVPDKILASTMYSFIDKYISQYMSLGDLYHYDHHETTNDLELLLAKLILSTAAIDHVSLVQRILELSKTQLKFSMSVFKWIVLLGHDAKYPTKLAVVLLTVWQYFSKENQLVGFLYIMLFEELKYPQTANKLPEKGVIAELHQIIVNILGLIGPSLITPAFKLLSGIGTTYQPESLKWLMKGLPTYESYMNASSHTAIQYMEFYVGQLYENHMAHIKINKELLDYYIMLLSVMVTFGSREAFRIRDIII